jgi:hypothetical protein
MITLRDPEYRRLSLDSSNAMMHYDGEWAQGNFEEAGRSMWQAGQQRLQMAALSQRAKDTSRALCDYLSAASCFIRTGNLKWADRALEGVAQEGPAPAGRPDIPAAHEIRKKERRKAGRRQQHFSKTLGQHPQWLRQPNEEALATIKEQLPEFCAWPRLYALLAYLENAQGDHEAAARHALLASEFDPEQPLLVCMALVARAKVEPVAKVLAWGARQRAQFHDDITIRVALAYLRALHARRRADYQEALHDLEPFARDETADLGQRIFALAVCAFLARELGDAALHGKALRELRELRPTLRKAGLDAPLAAELRKLIETVTNSGRSPATQADGVSDDVRKSLRGLEKTLTLTLACAAA